MMPGGAAGAATGEAIVGATDGTGVGVSAAMVPVLTLVAGVVLVPAGTGETRGVVVEAGTGAGVLTFVNGGGTVGWFGAEVLSTTAFSHGPLGRVPN